MSLAKTCCTDDHQRLLISMHLEGHVLKEMGHSIGVFILEAAASIDPETNLKAGSMSVKINLNKGKDYSGTSLLRTPLGPHKCPQHRDVLISEVA